MNKHRTKKNRLLSRKEFLGKAGHIALGASIAPWLLQTACSKRASQAQAATGEGTAETTFYIAKNSDPATLTRKAVDALGGMGKFVSENDKVALLPNIAWARTPEEAGNTHPDVVRALVEMCFEAGAKQVDVFCNPCNSPKVTYEKSGIAAAAQAAGAYVLYLADADFLEVDIPDGVWSKKNKAAKPLLNADVFINAPIAKHHGHSTLTLLQKNLMGVVKHRGELHPKIHPELVALQKRFPADLYVIDATRILLRGGPSNGNLNDVKKVGQVLAGVDPIAMEAYAATLFEKDPASIGFIKLGYEAGLGSIDWESCGEIVH